MSGCRRLVATARTLAPFPGSALSLQLAPPSRETNKPFGEPAYNVGFPSPAHPSDTSVSSNGAGKLRNPHEALTSIACFPGTWTGVASLVEFGPIQILLGCSE